MLKKLHKKPIRAVFLDRDGVINRSPGEGYVRNWKAFRFVPGSLEAIRKLAQTSFALVVISNQGGVAKKLYSRQDLKKLTQRMVSEIERHGGRLNQVQYCLHQESDGCSCRKPEPGMIKRACRTLPIDLSHSYLVGDDLKDIQLGKKVGCTTILALSGRTSKARSRAFPVQPDHVVPNLKSAVAWILKREKQL